MARFSGAIASLLALAGSAAAHVIPDSNMLNATELRHVEMHADGLLPTAPPPPKLSNGTLQSFQAIAVNEEFEVAFFSSLLWNITHNYAGYESWDEESQLSRQRIVEAIVAQEELHKTNALIIVEFFNKTAPQPCKYKFPTTTIKEAVQFAETFTAMVLGTLQDANQGAAAAGDDAVVRPISAVIGEEGQQDGWFRTLLGELPPAKPFLTTSLGPYLFSWLNNVVTIPGSCPYDPHSFGIPILPQLSVQGVDTGLNVDPKNQTLSFSADLSTNPAAKPYIGGDGTGLTATLLNGALLPISENITNVRWEGETIHFDAFFPFEENILFGLTVAALTVGHGFDPYTNSSGLAAATLAAPALINVNDYILF